MSCFDVDKRQSTPALSDVSALFHGHTMGIISKSHITNGNVSIGWIQRQKCTYSVVHAKHKLHSVVHTTHFCSTEKIESERKKKPHRNAKRKEKNKACVIIRDLTKIILNAKMCTDQWWKFASIQNEHILLQMNLCLFLHSFYRFFSCATLPHLYVLGVNKFRFPNRYIISFSCAILHLTLFGRIMHFPLPLIRISLHELKLVYQPMLRYHYKYRKTKTISAMCEIKFFCKKYEWNGADLYCNLSLQHCVGMKSVNEIS